MTHQPHSCQHLFFGIFHVTRPQLLVVLPLRERQLQRRFHALLNGGFRHNAQNRGFSQHARRIPGGQVIAACRFTQAALTQARLVHQLVRQLQHITRLAFQQFEFQFADRLLLFTRLNFTPIERDLNAALAFRHQPFFAPEIGAEQRLRLCRQRCGQRPFRPHFRRKTIQLKFWLTDVDIVFRTLVQTAHHATGDFHRHLVAPVRTPDAQAHIVVAQPVVRRFVIDVEQLYGFMVLAGQRIQMLAERVSAVFFDDKL